jgi:hypothetical protein
MRRRLCSLLPGQLPPESTSLMATTRRTTRDRSNRRCTRHEITEEDEARESDRGVQQRLEGFATIPLPGYVLDRVDEYHEGDVRVTGELDGDVAISLVRLVEPEARKVGLPESDAPRIIVAVRSALTERQESRPFDPLSSAEGQLAQALEPTPQPSGTAVVEPLPIERVANQLRTDLGSLGRWWQRFGDTPVGVFQAEVNHAGGMGPGGRENADVAQLRRALDFARAHIGRYCDQSGLQRPRLMRDRG